jgi:hypothetical protein
LVFSQDRYYVWFLVLKRAEEVVWKNTMVQKEEGIPVLTLISL